MKDKYHYKLVSTNPDHAIPQIVLEFDDLKNAIRHAIQMEDSDDYMHDISEVVPLKGEFHLITI